MRVNSIAAGSGVIKHVSRVKRIMFQTMGVTVCNMSVFHMDIEMYKNTF